MIFGTWLTRIAIHEALARKRRRGRMEELDALPENGDFMSILKSTSPSPEDGTALERHVNPALTAHDLAHLDGYQAACRLIDTARPLPACTLHTRPLPGPTPGRAALIRAAARTRQATRPAPANPATRRAAG